MSKETLLKGFRSEFSEYLRPKTIGVFDSILLANQFEEYLEKAIDQTREETIRKCEGVLPKERVIVNDDFHPAEDADYCKGDVSHAYNSAIKEIKQSLKSLINK